MNKALRTFAVAAVAILIAAFAWYRFAPGEAPAGQPPLVTIDANGLEGLRANFNRYENDTKIIVLLSPT